MSARLSVSSISHETDPRDGDSQSHDTNVLSLGLKKINSQSQSRILPTSWYRSQSRSRILANSGLSITRITVKYSELSIFFTLPFSRWWQDFWSSQNSLGLIKTSGGLVILVSVSRDFSWSQSRSRILPTFWSQSRSQSQSQILAHSGLSLVSVSKKLVSPTSDLDPKANRNFGLTQPIIALTQQNFSLTHNVFPLNSNFCQFLSNWGVKTQNIW